MRALLIEWDPSTGKRAGGINPKKDQNLICHNWQNTNVNPAIELRLIEDDRDLSRYEDIDGVTILIGKDVINTAIDDNFPSRIVIDDQLFYEEDVKEQIENKTIKIKDLPDDKNTRLRILKDMYHIKGIKEIEPQKV